MDSTDKVKTKPKVEYDGYYRVDTTSRDGKITHIYCRGHKLKSWLDFEKSLQSNMSVDYQLVTESEYMEHHWTAYPLDDEETITVQIIQPVQKPPVVQKVPKNNIKTRKKVSKTDRNIGDLSAFLSEEKPSKPKKSRKTQVVE